MWWKFKRHRVAVVSGIILLLMYGSTLVSEILAPYNLHTRNTDFIYAPPQTVHLFHDGHFVGPFVYGCKKSLNMETLRRDYTEDKSRPYPLRFFCSRRPLQVLGTVRGVVPPRLPGRGRRRCSCSAPTGWAATCCRASSTARASR